MGFDLSGLNPKINVPPPDILSKFHDEDGWNKWDEMSEKDKKIYFKADDKHKTANPGIYFRANVWWWRPIWTFVCFSCDFLSDKDCGKGGHNGGEAISKTKSKRIASRLRRFNRIGVTEAWVTEYMKEYKAGEIHNKKIQIQLNNIQEEAKKKHGKDIVPADYPEPYRTEWEALQDSEQWAGHYPFHGDNVRDFGEFCDNSGGFEIC